ncbi:substrate-binding domain-containing protein, partial [Streptomyces sp. NPDC018000]|uniref:substrate-binding domain-containing protein n=1 Tax=Streptomyces sp. NPDC018000 TaxID=3365028 RepID=UPI0037A6C5B6
SVLAQAGWPPLTSVDLGSTERGRHAAELLLECLREPGGAEPLASRTTTVPPRLVARASTAPAVAGS